MSKSFSIDHEAFVQSIRHEAVRRAQELGQITEDEAARLRNTKLVYGVGRAGVRGVCYYDTWTDGNGQTHATVEIGAASQESFVQLAGTTIHELAHVLAGHEAGHSVAWKDAAVRLGFTKRPEAAGQTYHLALFGNALRVYAANLAARLADGKPAFMAAWLGIGRMTFGPRPCSAGVGTRGGRSRGAGSGSRLRKYVCGHGQIIRAATDALEATCGTCGGKFELTA